MADSKKTQRWAITVVVLGFSPFDFWASLLKVDLITSGREQPPVVKSALALKHDGMPVLEDTRAVLRCQSYLGTCVSSG